MKCLQKNSKGENKYKLFKCPWLMWPGGCTVQQWWALVLHSSEHICGDGIMFILDFECWSNWPYSRKVNCSIPIGNWWFICLEFPKWKSLSSRRWMKSSWIPDNLALIGSSCSSHDQQYRYSTHLKFCWIWPVGFTNTNVAVHRVHSPSRLFVWLWSTNESRLCTVCKTAN